MQTPRDNEGRGLLCILFTDVVALGTGGLPAAGAVVLALTAKH